MGDYDRMMSLRMANGILVLILLVIGAGGMPLEYELASAYSNHTAVTRKWCPLENQFVSSLSSLHILGAHPYYSSAATGCTTVSALGNGRFFEISWGSVYHLM